MRWSGLPGSGGGVALETLSLLGLTTKLALLLFVAVLGVLRDFSSIRVPSQRPRRAAAARADESGTVTPGEGLEASPGAGGRAEAASDGVPDEEAGQGDGAGDGEDEYPRLSHRVRSHTRKCSICTAKVAAYTSYGHPMSDQVRAPGRPHWYAPRAYCGCEGSWGSSCVPTAFLPEATPLVRRLPRDVRVSSREHWEPLYLQGWCLRRLLRASLRGRNNLLRRRSAL